MQKHLLSKSKYIDGLQCAKRLWLEIHEPDLATPPDEAQQAVFDTGTRVGELARNRWPHGVLVEEDYWQHEAAVSTTRDLMADPSVEAIFEAGFTELGVRIRADVMTRVPGIGQWDLIEVKSSTSPKPQFDDDIAIQALIIEAAGLSLRQKMVLVIDNGYVFDGKELDPEQYFVLHDRSSAVTAKEQATRESLHRLHQVPTADAPNIDPSPHCRRPYLCPFWDHCTATVPENSIWQLPRISDKKFSKLQSLGFEEIAEIPDDFPLTYKQGIVRTAVKSGYEWISNELAEALLPEGPRTYYLDFETINPGVPVYEGSRPFESIPFQWSCHTRIRGEALEHAEFLADPDVDPRRMFAESIVEQLQEPGPIVVYSGFEKGVISALASRFPDLADPLRSITKRLWDLYACVSRNYYHPGFNGSYSIKSVLPALVPELAYDDLEIRSGSIASLSYMSLVTGDTQRGQYQENVQAMLKEYCARDTLATVEILDRLRTISIRS